MLEIEYLVQNKMKKTKVAIIINFIIFIFMVFALIMALTGLSFDMTIKKHSIRIFKYFTTLSNILMGLVALMLAIVEIISLKNNKSINKIYYFIKYIATISVTITFLTVALFLAPVFYGKRFFDAFHDTNFFYHFLNPVLSIIVFLFFENTKTIKFKQTFFGLIPFALYSIYYVIEAVTHMDNGKVMNGYDWYGFFYFGIPMFFVLMLFMFALTYGISFSLYKINNKLCK